MQQYMTLLSMFTLWSQIFFQRNSFNKESLISRWEGTAKPFRSDWKRHLGMRIITFLWSYLMITPSNLSSIAVSQEGASKTLPLPNESVFDYNFQLYIYMSLLISAFLIKSKASREKNCLIHYYSGMTMWRWVSATSMY